MLGHDVVPPQKPVESAVLVTVNVAAAAGEAAARKTVTANGSPSQRIRVRTEPRAGPKVAPSPHQVPWGTLHTVLTDRTSLGFTVTEMSRAAEPVVPDPFIAALRQDDPPDTVAECRSRAGSAVVAAKT
jgi:hypothetical protein